MIKQAITDLLSSFVRRLPVGVLLNRKYFEKYQNRGVHIVPNSFYFPIPDTTDIAESVFNTPSAMVGIDMHIDKQIALLEDFSKSYLDEYHALPEKRSSDYEGEYARTGGFGFFDGAMLYGHIRKFKPRRIIEIGCGQSTLLACIAIRKNLEEQPERSCHLTAIDPYPRDYFKSNIEDVAEVLEEKVQDVPLEKFQALEENDILFIDSSHTVRTGGDTVFEILEILPRLKKGVRIHFHDICFPYDYPKEWVVNEQKFWTEQYLLQAFLAFNNHFEMRWSFTYVQEKRPDVLEKHFSYFYPGIRKTSSIWMEKVQ